MTWANQIMNLEIKQLQSSTLPGNTEATIKIVCWIQMRPKLNVKWPSHSLDLNPIENMWSKIKRECKPKNIKELMFSTLLDRNRKRRCYFLCCYFLQGRLH